ncbi:MAG: aspartate/glutamate racemase family protein, partial [Oscillospiraceae bacterium]|nr:aspartate/glutamate racemase family protein [Oscillospiraceae bacterium]
MDARPIGLFDSGLGGLTAARTLEQLLPGEDLIYFGDSANAPYGVRPLPELRRLAEANTDFLLGFGVKAILVACGTVSSTVLDAVRRSCPVPMFDVVGPACAAVAESGAQRVAVAATDATIRSGAFDRALRSRNPALEVLSKACQSLVQTVEQGHFRPGDPEAEAAVARELAPVRRFRPQALLLA